MVYGYHVLPHIASSSRRGENKMQKLIVYAKFYNMYKMSKILATQLVQNENVYLEGQIK